MPTLHDERATRTTASAAVLLLTEIQAAEALGLSVRLLQQMRYNGGGPRFAKIGRAVRYPVKELQAWTEEHLRTSTSDDGTASAA